MLIIPDSLRFYWGDRANRAAVDILCGGDAGRTPPSDLMLDEFEAFETARLAAARVRHDLWRFLRAVWGETWGTTMASTIPSCRLLTVGEHDLGVNGTYIPSMQLAWDERTTYGLYALSPVITVFTGAKFEDGDRRVRFIFSIMDMRTSGYPEDFNFGPGWTDNGEGWVVAEAVIERREESQLDVEPAVAVLHPLAQRLVSFMASAGLDR